MTWWMVAVYESWPPSGMAPFSVVVADGSAVLVWLEVDPGALLGAPPWLACCITKRMRRTQAFAFSWRVKLAAIWDVVMFCWPS